MITIENLAFVHSQQFTLRAAHAVLPKGSATALIGPNGAGKTTFLHVLTGIYTPEHGTITFGQYNLTTAPLQAKQLFSFVPATATAFLNFTSERYWQLVISLFEVDQATTLSRCFDYAKQFQLTAADWSQPLHSCSLGTQKKLMFALAFALDCPVLICDEPFTGLDRTSREQLIKLFKTNKARGRTLIFSTHDFELVEQLADFTMLIEAGVLQPLQPFDPLTTILPESFFSRTDVGDDHD